MYSQSTQAFICLLIYTFIHSLLCNEDFKVSNFTTSNYMTKLTVNVGWLTRLLCSRRVLGSNTSL